MFCFLQRKKMIFYWYRKLIRKLPWYLYKPLGGCYACLTGEVLFWYYIIKIRPINVIDLLFYTSVGIALSYVYDKTMEWLLE